MPAPATAAEFADLVKKSQLVRGPALDRALGGPGAVTALAEPPDELAGRLVGEGLLTRFQADLLLQGKFRGFFIGPYKALDLIGSGGVGAVYLCQHPRMGHRAAVKVL